MQEITKRELSRNPARLSQLRPGESLAVRDRDGGLVIRREKKVSLTPAKIEAELQAIAAGGPTTNALAMMEAES